MKYKIGDRVRIIERDYSGIPDEGLKLLEPPFVATISYNHQNGHYSLKENNGYWWEGNIGGIYYDLNDIIESRFEILDL